jgi:hypothetical protein
LPITPSTRVPDRRRPGWGEFRRAYPGLIITMWVGLAVLLAVDGVMLYKRRAYAEEFARLRGGMSAVERQEADLELASNENHIRVLIEFAKRQAQGDKELHLSVAVDSGVMYLETDGALLREMPVRVGPERRVGTGSDTVHLVAPRGERKVEKVMTADSVWDVPRWVYADQKVKAPGDRMVRGALGDAAVVLDGGVVIYGEPTDGPLADSAYVLPGSLRARAADLRAIAPNLKPGTRVYLY